MKKLFTNFLGLALSVMVLASCSQMATYEQADLTPEEVAAAAKNGFNLTPYGTGGNENAALTGGGDCNTVCITSTSGSQYKATDSKTTTLQNGSKTLSVEVWNTLTTIEYRFLLNTTGNSSGNLQYYDEGTAGWINVSGLEKGQLFSVSRPLASGWKACDVVTEQWRQTGGGSQIVLDPSSYSLIGICTTTTIAKDSESSVCVEDGTVNLTGTVTSFGTFTGGNIKIQQFNGVSYVDVTSEAVGDGILVYAFDPSSAGTYTFRAAYDGTGSNGFNNSVSSDITVEAVNCVVACTESFSYVDNGDSQAYVFSYTPSESVTGANLVFTFAQGVAATGLTGWSAEGSTRQKTMDLVACQPYTWTVDLTPDCSGNSANSNVWTDFKVNDVSKKNSGTPNIVENCTL